MRRFVNFKMILYKGRKKVEKVCLSLKFGRKFIVISCYYCISMLGKFSQKRKCQNTQNARLCHLTLTSKKFKLKIKYQGNSLPNTVNSSRGPKYQKLILKIISYPMISQPPKINIYTKSWKPLSSKVWVLRPKSNKSKLNWIT